MTDVKQWDGIYLYLHLEEPKAKFRSKGIMSL